MEYQWLDVVKRLQAIAQAGLTYAENGYDLERYELTPGKEGRPPVFRKI